MTPDANGRIAAFSVSSPRKKPVKSRRDTYAEKARQLRAFGFHSSYGKKFAGSKGARYKAAVTKAWNRIGPKHVDNKRQQFKFVPLSKSQLKKARAILAGSQVTPRGAFIRVPKGTDPEKLKWHFDGEKLVTEYTGPRGGKRREESFSLDAEMLADDPAALLESILEGRKKPTKVFITVDGNEGRIPYSVELFNEYFPDFIAGLMDPTPEQKKKHGDPLEPEQIADIFGVKLVYQSPASTGKPRRHAKKSRRKVRRT